MLTVAASPDRLNFTLAGFWVGLDTKSGALLVVETFPVTEFEVEDMLPKEKAVDVIMVVSVDGAKL